MVLFFLLLIFLKQYFQISLGDFPHLLVFGPSGSGKKTRISCLLREVYGPGVDKVRIERQTFEASSKKIELSTIASNYHIEVNPRLYSQKNSLS